MTFQGRGTTSPSRSSKKYAPIPALEVIRCGPSQFGPSFPHAEFFAEPTTLHSTRSPGAKGRHNLASASVGNEPIEPLRFPFFHQSSLDLLLGFHRCLLD